jgi:DNA processing protein
MSGQSVRFDEQRVARAALTYLAEPGDPALGALLGICEPAEVLAAIKADMLPGTGPGCGDTAASRAALERALGRWRIRLPELPDDAGVAAARRDDIRLICPGDPEWPGGLDELGQARPYALWLRGRADLRLSSLRSVSMVGSRAATGYGTHVAGEIAADLGERGWTIVSGGAYGIDAAAHRGALVTHAITIAVLACGVDYPYPAGHAGLFADIAADGLVVSEWPPGRHPARLRFLVRNRVIASLTGGTVVVEAGERSGALNTARHAANLGRALMAVPGPVTSAQSAGCHLLIREWGGTLVTRAADVIEMLSPVGAADAPAAGLTGTPPPSTGTPPPSAGAPSAGAPSAGALSSGSASTGASSSGTPSSGPPGPGLLDPGPPPSDLPLHRSPSSDPSPSRDDLDLDSARVLDAFPARGHAWPATIAVDAGVDLDTVLRCLGPLAAYGFIERCDNGWRLRRLGRPGG